MLIVKYPKVKLLLIALLILGTLLIFLWAPSKPEALKPTLVSSGSGSQSMVDVSHLNLRPIIEPALISTMSELPPPWERPIGLPGRVEIDSVGINKSVVDYTDCNGIADPSMVNVSRDWCMNENAIYLVAHNPGIFTPLLKAKVGDTVIYRDSYGHESTFKIQKIFLNSRTNAQFLYEDSSSLHLYLQTCAIPDGSVDWIYRADPV